MGIAKTERIRVSLDMQVPFVIVHSNVLTPVDRPVTVDVALPGFVTVLPPAITVHNPLPVEGVLAPNVYMEVLQRL